MSSRKLKHLLAILVVVSQAGCRKQFSFSAPPPPSILKSTKYTTDTYNADLTVYNNNVTANAALARQTRDKIAYGFMGEIDDAYGQYTKVLYAGKGAFAVIGDTEVLGLTAAATIATHTPTKTILSALATGLTGVNLSFDKNFFAQQSFQAIAIAMQTRRDKARAAIAASLANDDGVQYPLTAARRDLISYYYAGTLPGGLQELQEEAGAAAAAPKTPALH